LNMAVELTGKSVGFFRQLTAGVRRYRGHWCCVLRRRPAPFSQSAYRYADMTARVLHDPPGVSTCASGIYDSLSSRRTDGTHGEPAPVPARRGWYGPGTAYRNDRASVARGNTLSLQAMRRKEPQTHFRRVVLPWSQTRVQVAWLLLAPGEEAEAALLRHTSQSSSKPAIRRPLYGLSYP
jgi:hypothetical protein